MSTPIRHDAPRTTLIPHPRRPVEAVPARPAAQQPDGERPSLFDRHGWLIPLCGIACVVALFTAMILLTWAAGGGSPFDR